MRILGIDPGLAAMGYGLVEDSGDGLRAVDYGVLSTLPEVTVGERLRLLYCGLRAVVERHRPTEVAVELLVARNLRTALLVGQARGVAILAVADSGLPVYEYTPLQVKQRVCGYGRGSKKQIQEMVRIQLGLSALPQPDDAADALAVAICHVGEARLSRLLANQPRRTESGDRR